MRALQELREQPGLEKPVSAIVNIFPEPREWAEAPSRSSGQLAGHCSMSLATPTRVRPSMHTRGPFSQTLIQQVQQGAILSSHLTVHTRGFPCLKRVQSQQNAAVPICRAMLSRERADIVGCYCVLRWRSTS